MMTRRSLVRAAWLVTVVGLSVGGCIPPGGMPGGLTGLDQQQPTIDTSVGAQVIGGASDQILAQVVTPGRAGRLVEVRLPVACSNGNLIVEIRYVSSTTGEPVGTAVSAQTIAGSTIPASGLPAVLRRVVFDVPVWVGVGDPLAIVLSSAGDCAIWAGPVGDPYTGGHAWFDARPNAPHVWVRANVGTGRDDLPFQTFVVP
jgi:hypothetical protein